jgi:hypothetical protein
MIDCSVAARGKHGAAEHDGRSKPAVSIPPELVGLAEHLEGRDRQLQATYYDWDDVVAGENALHRVMRQLGWRRIEVPDLSSGGGAFDYAALDEIELAVERRTTKLWLREWTDEEHPSAELHERKEVVFWFERTEDAAAALKIVAAYQAEPS